MGEGKLTGKKCGSKPCYEDNLVLSPKGDRVVNGKKEIGYMCTKCQAKWRKVGKKFRRVA